MYNSCHFSDNILKWMLHFHFPMNSDEGGNGFHSAGWFTPQGCFKRGASPVTPETANLNSILKFGRGHFSFRNLLQHTCSYFFKRCLESPRTVTSMIFYWTFSSRQGIVQYTALCRRTRLLTGTSQLSARIPGQMPTCPLPDTRFCQPREGTFQQVWWRSPCAPGLCRAARRPWAASLGVRQRIPCFRQQPLEGEQGRSPRQY